MKHALLHPCSKSLRLLAEMAGCFCSRGNWALVMERLGSGTNLITKRLELQDRMDIILERAWF